MAAGVSNRRLAYLLIVAVLAGAACTSHAAMVRVGRGERCQSIEAGLGAAQPGDTVLVSSGTYPEHALVVDKPIVLLGLDRPVVDARELGEIITVAHDGVTIAGLTLRNVGTSYVEDRAAIRLKEVENVVIEGNRIENAFFGVYAEHSRSLFIRGNIIVGLATREVGTGNGIHLWYCRDAVIEDNEIRGHRDGIYFEFVEESRIARNVSTHNIRYGLHFMFSHHDAYIDNLFAENGAGVAVMYTEYVTMIGNTFDHNWGMSSYGLLLKDIRDSEIRYNHFRRNTVGLYAEGCNRITVEENEFAGNGYAARIMANSMDNTFRRNNFVGNSFDVVTNSRQNFNVFDSNYWGEYDGYDLDGNGVGDVPHHPVRLFSLLCEKAPPGIVLLNSLFVTLIDTAERVMPVFTPETLVDASPRMSMVVVPENGAPARQEGSR
jgi:nitrous oxidase accessory protein